MTDQVFVGDSTGTADAAVYYTSTNSPNSQPEADQVNRLALNLEITQALHGNKSDDDVVDFLNNTHFVFRGGPCGAGKMIEEMEKKEKG